MPDQWTVYFAAVAGVAATLLGLVFVAFQMSTSWHDDRLRRVVAMQTLAELLAPVLVGLSTLTPGDEWRYVAGACGLAGLGLVAWHVAVYRRAKADEHSGSGRALDEFDRDQLRLDVFPVVMYSLVLLAAVFEWPRILGLVLLWFIFSGSVEAFQFMRHRVVEPATSGPPEPVAEQLRPEPAVERPRPG